MPDPIEVSIVRSPITPMRSTFEYDTIVFNGADVPRLNREMNALGARGFQLVRIEQQPGVTGLTVLLLFFEKWCPVIEEDADDG